VRTLVRKIHTIRLLSPCERRLAGSAIILMGIVRIALWVVPFRALKRITTSGRISRLRFSRFSEEQVAWAVRLATRYVPRASCLTQALAAQNLLNWSGLESRLHIGVNREAGFKAHAWIECAGRILVGGAAESAGYSAILTFEGTHSELKSDRIL
jgi:hypothetical protein